MTIGAVLATLHDDFPDVSISKIRFLEAEGLVTPARTGSGYRSYSEHDLERLRYILAAQRDHYWPLKVIRDALDALDRGLTSDSGAGAALGRPRVPDASVDPDLPTAADLAPSAGLLLTRDELMRATGLEESAFEALATFGLLRADQGGHFGESALAIAHAASGLAAYGIEPRHLRPFRTAADREVGLVQQVVTPHRAEADPTPDVLRLCIALHTALVKDGLSRG
jgi:DNA-binding transcriptional MerR regulator